MSSPQVEAGYTRIANELMDALCKIRIPGEAMQMLYVIIRKTYGFNKPSDVISLGQFAEMTGLSRPHLVRNRAKLEDMNLIIVRRDGSQISYSVNKDHATWIPLEKRKPIITRESSLKPYCYLCGFSEAVHHHHITPRSEGGPNKVTNIIPLCPNCHALVHRGKCSKEELLSKKETVESVATEGNGKVQNDQKPLPKREHTKDNITKDKKDIKDFLPSPVPQEGNGAENPQSEPPVTTEPPNGQATARVKEYPPEIVEFVTAFQNHALKVHGRKAQPITPALVNSGCKAIDQIIRLDKFTLDEIRETMRWAAKDDFWADNVLSLAGLRRLGDGGVSKFKTIRLRFEAAQQGKQSSGSVKPNGNQQARACLDALFELRRLGKWKAPSAYSSSLKVDCSSLEPDPVRDAALRSCPPPNDTWKIDNAWGQDFLRAYTEASKSQTNQEVAA